MQHERAPRSISKGKNSTNGLASSREKRKKSISKVKYENEQPSSEPNSPYSSPVSPQQWDELESSVDTVFSSFDSRLKKGDEKLRPLFKENNVDGDSKLPGNIKGTSFSNDGIELLNKTKASIQNVDEKKHENNENFQLSNSSTEGEISTTYDENNNNKSSSNIDISGRNLDNKDDINDTRKSGMTIEARDKPAVTNFGYFREQNIPHELLPPNSFSLYDSSIQLLYMSVSWARNIPMFLDLPFRDQAILLEEAWSELFLLSAVHYFLPVDTTTLLSATGLNTKQCASSTLTKEIRTLQNVIARFHQLQMNTVEFACLKAVVLFKSGTFIVRFYCPTFSTSIDPYLVYQH